MYDTDLTFKCHPIYYDMLITPKHDCGTLKCENAAICEKVANCENNVTLNVKKMRLSKCVKHFDSKCVKIDAICANFILTLFVKIKF